jgi:hypothetical protein
MLPQNRSTIKINYIFKILKCTNKGMYNDDILAVPRRINADVEERER